MKINFIHLEEKINYKFKDEDLLQKSLIHRSYSNENVKYKNENNEKLELLGDTILNLIATEHLYFKFKNLYEGDLVKLRSKLVSEPVLAEFANNIQLGKYLSLSKGEIKNGGRIRASILSDAFEALLGALYIDASLDAVKSFLVPILDSKLNTIEMDKSLFDYKTAFQEYTQLKYKDIPLYKVIYSDGPDHLKTFKVIAEINGLTVGEGIGSSKKEAEQNTAKDACEKLNISLENKNV